MPIKCKFVFVACTFYLFTIECPSSCGKSSAHDVHIINLSLQHEIKILADKKETVSPPSSLNITRVSNLYKLTRHLGLKPSSKVYTFMIMSVFFLIVGKSLKRTSRKEKEASNGF